jgi:hypothetical protein
MELVRAEIIIAWKKFAITSYNRKKEHYRM